MASVTPRASNVVVPPTKRSSEFTVISTEFTLRDIGASFIDQISSDIYTEPSQILREVVKNAYDAYRRRGDAFAEQDRQIVISRYREEPNGKGHVLIADRGHGQTADDLRKNVKISVSDKPQDSDDATGFRGLGSWSLLGGGSRIVISSTVAGSDAVGRLVINVREIYTRINPTTTLDDILNDERCIELSERPGAAARDERYTVVDIEVDGAEQKVGGYEINRLYDYTDHRDQQLRAMLLSHCQIPYNLDGGANREIRKACTAGGYVPTQIFLDGVRLQRRLPPNLTTFTEEFRVGTKVVAQAWYAENVEKTRAIPQNDADPEITSPGIQILKLNVPIGPKNLYSPLPSRSANLNWYVGEVHIVAKDIQPSANGTELRASEARDAFLNRLNEFYSFLDRRAREKSERLSAKRNLEAIVALAKDATTGEALMSSAAQQARDVVNSPKRRQELINADPALDELIKNATRAIRKLERLPPQRKPAAPKTKTPKTRTPKPVLGQPAAPRPAGHKYLAPVIPQLQELGLSTRQLEEVIAVASDVATALSRLDVMDLEQAQRSAVLDALSEMMSGD